MLRVTSFYFRKFKLSSYSLVESLGKDTDSPYKDEEKILWSNPGRLIIVLKELCFLNRESFIEEKKNHMVKL